MLIFYHTLKLFYQYIYNDVATSEIDLTFSYNDAIPFYNDILSAYAIIGTAYNDFAINT